MGRDSYIVKFRLIWALVVAAAPAVAVARPAADLVVVWAPGVRTASIDATAREAGAAVINRSPATRAPLATSQTLAKAIAEFDALRIEEATHLFDEVKADADRTGGAELPPISLSDLFLYRARIAFDRGDSTAAWEAMTTALVIAPTRVIDPARFAPAIIAEAERARGALALRGTATLAVTVPSPQCSATIDGAPAAQAKYLVGQHWIAVRCPDREPWGTRVELVADMTLVAGNAILAPPTDDEMLIQARTAGASAYIVVFVSSGVAVLRLVGTDGRERDRRTVTADRDLRAPALALAELLTPVATGPRWYERRATWAVIGAVVTAAIVIPITIATTRDTTPKAAVGTPTGIPF